MMQSIKDAIDRNFRFLLLEVVIDIKAWWTLPARQVELELDEFNYMMALTRLVVIAVALEGLVAIKILQFLYERGQL